MPVPVFRHHDAAKIRVAADVDAEEVEDFALVEVGRGPNGRDAVNGGVFAVEANDEANALFQRHGEDVVGDLVARLRGIPVDGGDVFEEFVPGLLDGLAGSDDVLPGYGDGQLGAVVFCIGGEIGQRFNGGVVGGGLEDGLFSFDGGRGGG